MPEIKEISGAKNTVVRLLVAGQAASRKTCRGKMKKQYGQEPRVKVPNLSGTRNQFRGRLLFSALEMGVGRWFQDDSDLLHLLCPLLHQLHLSSSDIRS